MFNILWVSQHPPLEIQVEWLRNKLGKVNIVEAEFDKCSWNKKFTGANEILKMFRERDKNGIRKYDELFLVAPLSVMRVILQHGVQPIRTQLKKVDVSESNVTLKNGHYKFTEFKRVTAITIHQEDILRRTNENN